MSDLTNFSEGASVLQQVDVSDIFKNLALGIAEAQQKLDDNSIAQAIKLAETQINGVSLLELGFAPVFYGFQYADISASINLKMGLKEAVEFGFGLDLRIANTKGYAETDHKFLSENSYSETSEEYKTAREVSFRAKEKKSLKIDNHFFKLNEDLAAKSRVEKLKEDIVAETSVEQVYENIQSEKLSNNVSRGVDVWIDNGFLRVEQGLHYDKSGVGVFKIRDSHTTTPVDIDGPSGTFGSFNVQTEMDDTLNAALAVPSLIPSPATQLFALSKSGLLYTYIGSAWEEISSTMYFAFNSDEISYDKVLKRTQDPSGSNLEHGYTGGSSFTNKNHDKHELIHKVLRLIQNSDSNASITITGKTDPKGGDNPKNQSLAKRRAERLRNHIFGSDKPVNVKVEGETNASGSSDLLERYARIELDADYIIFVGGNIKKAATPNKASTNVNKFVYADDTTEGTFIELNVDYGSTSLAYSTDNNFTALLSHVESTLETASYELKEGRSYFLDDEAIVKFHLLTNQSEDISISEDEENESEGTENSSSYLWSKSKNEKSALSENLNNNTQNKSFAFGASVDFRMSRQFEMSMEGNSAMSARLVALPAPEKFIDFLNTNYGTQTTEE